MSDWKEKTQDHIDTVRHFMAVMIADLEERAVAHDATKLEDPEASIFAEYTDKLKGSTYGSEEYNQFLVEMKVALDHHYGTYRHHPEHFENGIADMNLIDLVEMLCDWKAATLRHADGDIYKSIELNQKRFGYSDDIKKLLLNTLEVL